MREARAHSVAAWWTGGCHPLLSLAILARPCENCLAQALPECGLKRLPPATQHEWPEHRTSNLLESLTKSLRRPFCSVCPARARLSSGRKVMKASSARARQESFKHVQTVFWKGHL